MKRTYSIILPVRNGGEHVKLCVASILAQTFDADSYNLIVLDNCSKDGTLEWIKQLADKRIIIHESGRDLTIEENWGRIINVPKNEFITLIGHDDILYPDYLLTMEQLIQQHPNATLYQSHFNYINAEGKIIRACQPMDERQSGSEFLGFFLCNTIDTTGTGYLMRAADYNAAGGIPNYPNLLFADSALWLQLSMKGYKATAFNNCFAFRLHQSATTTSTDIKFQQAFERFIYFLAALKLDDPVYAAVIERYALQFIRFYCKGLAHKLLRTSLKDRQAITVTSFLAQCKSFADILVPGNDFNPQDGFPLKIAAWIDSNAFTRQAFLFFKKHYRKPLYK